MNSAIVLLVGVAAMLCGYLFYSKFIATKILALDNSRPTPAHPMKDGVDYVPQLNMCYGDIISPQSLERRRSLVLPLP